MRRGAAELFCAVVVCWMTSSAQAQLREGVWRGWVDVDVFAVGTVQENPRGPIGTTKTTVVGVGPNQLGASRAYVPTSPLGVGFAYALKPKWMLGLRSGLGFDNLAPNHGPNQKVLGFSFMPEVTFVPIGNDDTKLFAKFSPIIQYGRIKEGSAAEHIFMGCFSFGVGGFFFLTKSSSIDLGAYFEGRFGRLKPGLSDSSYVDVDDLRGLLRLGLSLWK